MPIGDWGRRIGRWLKLSGCALVAGLSLQAAPTFALEWDEPDEIFQTGFFDSMTGLWDQGCGAPAAPAPSCCEDKCGWCNLGEPFAIGSWLEKTDCCGNKTAPFKIAGWTQIGYQNNPDGAFTGNGPFNNDYFGAGFNNAKEWDRLNLNQQYFYIEKVADGSNGVGFGFRADLYYGVDGNEGQSFGNNPGKFDFLNGWDHGIYEWALPQIYGEVAYENTSVKLGHFYTPVGYEVIPSTGNFFLSRQLTFYNSEPFTHTGVLATTKATDKLQVLYGWTLGMDTGFDQLSGGSSALGGMIYTLSDKTTFTYMFTAGDLGWRGNGAINSAFITHNWTEKFQSVHQFDILGSDLRAGGVPTDFATTGITGDSIGQINYGFYQFNDCVKAGVRQEWYKADGVSYYTLTYGVNVKPHANVVIRPEVRHMWSPGNDNPLNPGGHSLFNQTVVGVDAIVSY